MALHPILHEKLNLAVIRSAEQKFTPRDVRLPAIQGKVHAVIGMRRSGKTTFLRQLRAKRLKKLSPERAVYISFDDDRLLELPPGQLSQLMEEYYRRYPELRGKETVYWFLDEIQLVEGWERFVRRVIDSERIEIVVSGSSARMLSREVHTSLRGRSMETVIRPFSFREFLRHRDEEPLKPVERLTPTERSMVEKRFREYLREGGFPEAQGLSTNLRVELLQGYVSSVLFRDVVERFGVTRVSALKWLMRHCLRNPGGALSLHRFYRDLRAQGHAVSKDALHAMFGYLNDAFLVSAVPLSAESERKRNSNPRKVYPVDTGLIQAFDASGRTNEGHALETVVLTELERSKAEVGYVKTRSGFEVDFHARFPDGREELIQVCADLASPGTRERELRALEEASAEYPRASRRLLLLDRDLTLTLEDRKIAIQPVYEWLLGEKA